MGLWLAVRPMLQLSAASAAIAAALAPGAGPQQLESAIVKLERAAVLNPDSPLVYRHIGQGYLALERPQAALQALEQAYRLAPDSLLVQRELALSIAASEATQMVNQEREAIYRDLINWAETARARQDFSEVLFWYQRLAALDYDLISASAFIQSEIARARGDDQIAVSQLIISVQNDTGWATPQQRLEAWRAYGRWLIEQGDYAEVIPVLREIERILTVEHSAAEHAEVHRLLGLALWNIQDLANALNEMERARGLDPHSVWGQIHYGKVLFVADPSRLPEVRAAFTQGLFLSNQDANFYRNLLEFWAWQNQPAEITLLCAEAEANGVGEQIADLCQ